MNSAKMGHKRACLWLAVMGLIGATSVHAADMKKLQAQSLGVTPGNQLAAKLGLSADNSFVAQGAAKTVRGTQVVRMQQYYKGVPVYGRSIAVEQDVAGNALTADGAVLQNVQVDLGSVAPRLSTTQALSALPVVLVQSASPSSTNSMPGLEVSSSCIARLSGPMKEYPERRCSCGSSPALREAAAASSAAAAIARNGLIRP